MLVYASRLIGTPVLSVRAGGRIAVIAEPIVDPDNLKIIAFKLAGPRIAKSSANILDVRSIREYSNYGIVIDDIDELLEKDDVVKISDVLRLNFALNGLKVETKKGSKLGKIEDYTLTSEDFVVQQLIVKRPMIKSFIDPELTIPRKEIIEITDYKIIVKDEEKTIKIKAEKEEFVPNFVNPFRKSEQDFAPAEAKSEKPKN
ncbi:MAG: hypothetical protein Q4F61_02240 [Candidatus Saccharibacteria bacterium]|nr:hypothetical protein [Candidatus Saccharibacteria bacterium]